MALQWLLIFDRLGRHSGLWSDSDGSKFEQDLRISVFSAYEGNMMQVCLPIVIQFLDFCEVAAILVGQISAQQGLDYLMEFGAGGSALRALMCF